MANGLAGYYSRDFGNINMAYLPLVTENRSPQLQREETKLAL